MRPRPELALAVQLGSGIPACPVTRPRLRRWVLAALQRDARITLRFVGTREARALNRAHRGRDYATNVLTFVYDDAPVLSGDIALCAPVIAREARQGAIALDAHYAHLVVHGMLHLQGHDHLAERDAEVMEARETAVLKRLGYPDPYRSTH